MSNSDEHFLYFSLKTDIQDDKKIIQLKFEEEYDFLRYLEDEFRIVIVNSKHYLNAYASNGFLSSNKQIIAWEKSEYIIDKNQSIFIDEIMVVLKKYIENIVIGGNGDNFMEMRFKLGTLFYYYDFSRKLSYTLYSSYDLYLGKEELSYDFYVKDYETQYISGENFKIIFNCEILVKGCDEVLIFDILAFSPLAYIKEFDEFDILETPNCCLPHIITNKFNIDGIINFIKNTINHFEASSIEELKLKISAFSPTKLNYDISIPLVEGEKYRLKIK